MPTWSCPRIFDDRSRYLDRFGALLALTCAAVITLSLSGVSTATAGTKGPIATAVVSVFVGLTLLLALRASGVARTWVRLADAVVGLGMTAALLLVPVALLEQTEARATDMRAIMVTWVVLSALAPVVIVRRLLRHREVTLRTCKARSARTCSCRWPSTTCTAPSTRSRAPTSSATAAPHRLHVLQPDDPHHRRIRRPRTQNRPRQARRRHRGRGRSDLPRDLRRADHRDPRRTLAHRPPGPDREGPPAD